ncbi:hypothetical protein E2C01_069321 [Portunus trituberculatus]|uniref:Uncharacterized protein n=1 Tax=Portunus trituberculatus TaxID=210409 RepID=A0A5B7HPS1_PORTR|nr:hypothetical protein [Portunus trituberculatus]
MRGVGTFTSSPRRPTPPPGSHTAGGRRVAHSPTHSTTSSGDTRTGINYTPCSFILSSACTGGKTFPVRHYLHPYLHVRITQNGQHMQPRIQAFIKEKKEH